MKRAILLAALLAACGDEASEPEPVEIVYSVRSADADQVDVIYTRSDGSSSRQMTVPPWETTVHRRQGQSVTVSAACYPDGGSCGLQVQILQAGVVLDGVAEKSDNGSPLVIEASATVK